MNNESTILSPILRRLRNRSRTRIFTAHLLKITYYYKMKKIKNILALCAAALLLTNCRGPDSDTSPFVGQVEFTAKVMGVESGGTMTIDAEDQKITYRVDALKDFLGMDMVVMLDLKEMMSYSISPKDKIYTKVKIDRKDMKGELPSKKEIDEMRKEIFSKLKATGKEQTISGYTCEEHEIIEKIEGVEDTKIWFSKSFLDRISPMWYAFSEIKELDIDDMLIGFPMKAEGKGFTFEVTKITEGKEATNDLDLSGYKELNKMEFMMKIMKDSPMGDMLDQFEGIEGITEQLENLEALKDIDVNLEKINDLMEQFN